MSYSVLSPSRAGLRGLGAAPPCPSKFGCSTSTDIPAGLSPAMMNGVVLGAERLMDVSDPKTDLLTAGLCNRSGIPLYCYYAKLLGKTYAGRGTAEDVKKWIAWMPKTAAGAPVQDMLPPDGMQPLPAPDSGPSDKMVMGGLAVAAVLVLGAVFYVSRH